jgi:hypothetical protein
MAGARRSGGRHHALTNYYNIFKSVSPLVTYDNDNNYGVVTLLHHVQKQ